MYRMLMPVVEVVHHTFSQYPPFIINRRLVVALLPGGRHHVESSYFIRVDR